jgi:hypothetical protein
VILSSGETGSPEPVTDEVVEVRGATGTTGRRRIEAALMA